MMVVQPGGSPRFEDRMTYPVARSDCGGIQLMVMP